MLTLESLGEVLEKLPHNRTLPAIVTQTDAASIGDLKNFAAVISTDPPYYDNIGYLPRLPGMEETK